VLQENSFQTKDRNLEGDSERYSRNASNQKALTQTSTSGKGVKRLWKKRTSLGEVAQTGGGKEYIKGKKLAKSQ